MNVFTGIGNIGRDATLQTVGQNNTPVCRFSVAITSGYGDNKKTSWLGCSLWGARATKVQPYLLKGTRVGVTGEIALDAYTDNSGQQKTILSCNVQNVTLCGSPQQQGQQAPAPQQQPQQQPAQPASQPVANNYADDIPF